LIGLAAVKTAAARDPTAAKLRQEDNPMASRHIMQVIPALEVSEGAGVRVLRSIGTPARRHLDPFLMLDHFNTEDPDDYIAGFPDHPHRGFNTFTYMLDGHMRHADSMGNSGDLAPGGAQWMKAGSGVIHSEMPQQQSGRMRGFQLWINLPAAEKMSAPEYHEIAPRAIPQIELNHARVRLLAGTLHGQQGPVADGNTQFQLLDVAAVADGEFTHRTPAEHTAFIYLFEGSALVGASRIETHELAVLDRGESVTIKAGREGARYLLAAGRTIGEPIVQHGPFVMNTRKEIEQAVADYRDGRLVQAKAAMVNHQGGTER
jgi:quercetin 2,3-dioxygenase